jgi:hypothetical protein
MLFTFLSFVQHTCTLTQGIAACSAWRGERVERLRSTKGGQLIQTGRATNLLFDVLSRLCESYKIKPEGVDWPTVQSLCCNSILGLAGGHVCSVVYKFGGCRRGDGHVNFQDQRDIPRGEGIDLVLPSGKEFWRGVLYG